MYMRKKVQKTNAHTCMWYRCKLRQIAENLGCSKVLPQILLVNKDKFLYKLFRILICLFFILIGCLLKYIYNSKYKISPKCLRTLNFMVLLFKIYNYLTNKKNKTK